MAIVVVGELGALATVFVTTFSQAIKSLQYSMYLSTLILRTDAMYVSTPLSQEAVHFIPTPIIRVCDAMPLFLRQFTMCRSTPILRMYDTMLRLISGNSSLSLEPKYLCDATTLPQEAAHHLSKPVLRSCDCYTSSQAMIIVLASSKFFIRWYIHTLSLSQVIFSLNIRFRTRAHAIFLHPSPLPRRAHAQLFWTRAVTGVAIGGGMPLVYSILGDLVGSTRRTEASGLVGISIGFGSGMGQVTGERGVS